MSVFKYTQNCQYGLARRPSRELSRLAAQKMPMLLRQQEVNLGDVNKVFASEWLSENQVIIGTKCNSLMVLDLNTNQRFQIPLLKDEGKETVRDTRFGGIHSIAVNPSRMLLATGGEDPNSVAVYKLPTFDPVCLGNKCHEDWIFSMEWLDDQFLATGCRDNTIALWSVKEELYRDIESQHSLLPEYRRISPLTKKQCNAGEKVRALAYNDRTQEIAALSTNGYIHMWDAHRFTQNFTVPLPYCRENVCLAISNDLSVYAVGSQSHVSFLDSRTLKSVGSIYTKEEGSGVRSLSFNEEIATIGTGAGSLLFFDIRAGRYLEFECCTGEACILKSGKGFLLRDHIYNEYFAEQHDYPNAVYTHCYDASKTKLFAAGGPLSSGLHGNYAAVWH
ncbi:DDB1- and CUL4-associated factor 12-like [Glandiceps talaboti]